MTRRISNWEQALSDYLASKRKDQFSYGSFDCANFVSGAVEAMTGENPMADVGKYDSLLTSVKMLKSLGADNLEAFIDTRFEEVPIGFAQTGDLAFYDGSVGVVVNAKAVFATEIGYTMIDRSVLTKTWRVGRG